ncbi:hypothetical protein POVWA2_035210 [Plasmodium ovale wallikeri]|uniref:Uncharacterized protein n=1 Tax=Plasmodium ovale wallikeri TaxID=864142 RepID=A0A1A8Z0N7_PLAOA|nr:hypothetical protein POVWA1_035920 [Plasmodium ovale wallikeri]SBT38225.1 hypothetical protein POVWA2_035210 [Plasmodium ovale wallikeri]
MTYNSAPHLEKKNFLNKLSSCHAKEQRRGYISLYRKGKNGLSSFHASTIFKNFPLNLTIKRLKKRGKEVAKNARARKAEEKMAKKWRND